MKKYILFLPFILFFLPLVADVATPGEIGRDFRIENTEEFPDYRFFYLHQNYYYEMGYQEGSLDTIWIQAGEDYSGGDRTSTSRIYAIKKGKSDQVFTSKEAWGGKTIVPNGNLTRKIDVLKIKGFSGNKLKVKKVKTLDEKRNLDGSRSEVMPMPAEGFLGRTGSFLAFSAVGLISLIILIRVRKKSE